MADAPNAPAVVRPRTVLDSVPGLKQLIMLIAVAASVAAAVWLVIWMQGSGYSLLYGHLSERETGQVIDALTAAGIPYKMDGGAVLVADGRVHEARIKLAGEGLPQSTSMGVELIEKDPGFGTSQFMEKARYQHALETELARTIINVQGVQNARVHLALPPPSVFVRDRKSPSASVMLQLYPGRRLDQGQTAAIVHLVASSVPELVANQVTVIDQSGNLLNSPDDSGDMALSAKQFEYTRQVEESYARRIEDLLEPITGPNRARARVTADMDFTRKEETQENYNPQNPVIRSEQTANDQRMAGDTAQGIPGALSNQPPATAPGVPPAAQQQPAAAAGAAAAAAQPVSTSARATRNFEIDRTISHTRGQIGVVRKLSVAVVVDNWQKVNDSGETTSTPLTEAEVQRLTSLIKEAIGFNEARGDRVNVMNNAFHAEPPLPEADEPSLFSQPWVKTAIKQGIAAILVLVLAFVVLKPIVSSLTQPARGGATLTPDQLMLSGMGGAMGQGNYDQQVAAARGLVGQDPKRAAAVMKEWVNG